MACVVHETFKGKADMAQGRQWAKTLVGGSGTSRYNLCGEEKGRHTRIRTVTIDMIQCQRAISTDDRYLLNDTSLRISMILHSNDRLDEVSGDCDRLLQVARGEREG